MNTLVPACPVEECAIGDYGPKLVQFNDQPSN